jgi:primary-amine oxidase
MSAHPLDPLSAEEIAQVARVLRAGPAEDMALRFVSVELREPGKAAIAEGRRGGAPVGREAFAVLLDRRRRLLVEAVVSLSGGAVTSWHEVPGAQPAVMREECAAADTAVRMDPRWQDAISRRGVTDLSVVDIDIWAAGSDGPDGDPSRRLARALCYVRASQGDNGYARPVEGLVVTVDLWDMTVVEVSDQGAVPLPPEPGNYRPEQAGTRTDVRPIEIRQPEGPSFHLDGWLLSWQNWRLRIGFTPREGLVLHQVGYLDHGRWRPILHRAAVCELYVPYGDPNPTHEIKNVFDVGEWGLGFALNSLELGCDCLGEIRYLDVTVHDENGEPVIVPQGICVHEEDHGVAWKHTERRTGTVETRRARRLVISCFATVNNYDYGFYWYLHTDGRISFELELTGIVSTGAVPAGEPPACGTPLAPGLYAPNHQHFASVRLDMAVDGTRNTVYEVDSVPLAAGHEDRHANAWTTRATPLSRESEAKRRVEPAAARAWSVVNPSVPGPTGAGVGYQLVPGETAPPLARAGSETTRRAGFTGYHLWVTAYDAAERYAAGDYPYRRPDEGGLPAYAAADRPISDTDIVVWYTLGAHHIPRPEDWPVMPVTTVGFTLRPVGFFDANPALDLPRP